MVKKGEAISDEILDATVKSTMKNTSSVEKVMEIAAKMYSERTQTEAQNKRSP